MAILHQQKASCDQVDEMITRSEAQSLKMLAILAIRRTLGRDLRNKVLQLHVSEQCQKDILFISSTESSNV